MMLCPLPESLAWNPPASSKSKTQPSARPFIRSLTRWGQTNGRRPAGRNFHSLVQKQRLLFENPAAELVALDVPDLRGADDEEGRQWLTR